jgi:Tol biopolymer transport system component
VRRSRLAVAAIALATLAAPATADAFYGNGAQIVSADFGRLEQADDTTQFAALASDGRYATFQTRARNFFADDDPDPPGEYRRGGIFRIDVDTLELALVADGDTVDEATNVLLTRGAQSPSISADGRFVAFSTAQQLVPADVNRNIDVYVRDMTIPIRSPGAFDLVSAKDGGDVPASYAPPSAALIGGDLGSEVARGAALSLDGDKVVFRVTEPASDLPDRPGLDTPGQQVFVRDRAANTTTLVTRVNASGAAAGGANGPAGISGDGTTVVWNGQNAALQTPFLNGENTDLPGFSYYLWRRVADGPAAPTRRITGMADLDDPACQPTGPIPFDELLTGPCYGPLASPDLGISANFNQLPALSADGRRLAFLTNARPRGTLSSGLGLDLYVTDMSPGVTRKAGTVELTREGASSAESAPIESVSMSADGSRVAIVTARTRFVLSALTQIGPPRAVADAQDVYVIDLATHTIERATRSYGGGDIDSAVTGDTSLSGDGGRVAFTSFAGNLFFGDANQRADAFVATRQPDPPAQPPPPPPGAGGPDGSVEVDVDRGDGPRIKASARSRPRGVVVLTVSVPAAGGVKATARARAGTPRKPRAIATGSARARARGRVRIVLRPVRRYRPELRRRGTIAARVQVGYVASRGGRKLRTSARILFRQRPR